MHNNCYTWTHCFAEFSQVSIQWESSDDDCASVSNTLSHDQAVGRTPPRLISSKCIKKRMNSKFSGSFSTSQQLSKELDSDESQIQVIQSPHQEASCNKQHKKTKFSSPLLSKNKLPVKRKSFSRSLMLDDDAFDSSLDVDSVPVYKSRRRVAIESKSTGQDQQALCDNSKIFDHSVKSYFDDEASKTTENDPCCPVEEACSPEQCSLSTVFPVDKPRPEQQLSQSVRRVLCIRLLQFHWFFLATCNVIIVVFTDVESANWLLWLTVGNVAFRLLWCWLRRLCGECKHGWVSFLLAQSVILFIHVDILPMESLKVYTSTCMYTSVNNCAPITLTLVWSTHALRVLVINYHYQKKKHVLAIACL